MDSSRRTPPTINGAEGSPGVAHPATNPELGTPILETETEGHRIEQAAPLNPSSLSNAGEDAASETESKQSPVQECSSGVPGQHGCHSAKSNVDGEGITAAADETQRDHEVDEEESVDKARGAVASGAKGAAAQEKKEETEEEREKREELERKKEVFRKLKEETARLQASLGVKEPSQSLPFPKRSGGPGSMHSPYGAPSLDTAMIKATSHTSAAKSSAHSLGGVAKSPAHSLGAASRAFPKSGSEGGRLLPTMFSINAAEDGERLTKAEKQRRAEIEAKAQALTRGFRNQTQSTATTPTHRRGQSTSTAVNFKSPRKEGEKGSPADAEPTNKAEPDFKPKKPVTRAATTGTKKRSATADLSGFKDSGDFPDTRDKAKPSKGAPGKKEQDLKEKDSKNSHTAASRSPKGHPEELESPSPGVRPLSLQDSGLGEMVSPQSNAIPAANSSPLTESETNRGVVKNKEPKSKSLAKNAGPQGQGRKKKNVADMRGKGESMRTTQPGLGSILKRLFLRE